MTVQPASVLKIASLMQEDTAAQAALYWAEHFTEEMADNDVDNDVAVAALALALAAVVGQYPAEIRDYVLARAVESAKAMAPHTVPFGEL